MIKTLSYILFNEQGSTFLLKFRVPAMVVNVGNVERMVKVLTKVGRIHWVIRGGSFLVGILKLQ